MEKTWRLIIDGGREPEVNMALDEAIMLGMAEAPSQPTLRIYRWLYPCISIGRFQNSLTLPAPLWGEGIGEGNNLAVVRRPTGGGSVLHDGSGFTYSLIYREDSGAVPKGAAASYRHIHKGVAAALKELGLEAELYPPISKIGRAFGACFESPVESDVVFAGKKVAGAAQRRRFGIVLHEGEISLSLDVLANRSYNTVSTAFINSLSKQLQARFLEGKISEKENCLAEGLLMEHIIKEVSR